MNIEQERRVLLRKGFINEDNTLNPKALELVSEISGHFKKAKKKTNAIVMGTDWEANAVIYNELFPKKKLNSGRYARSAIGNVKPGLRWFFDNNNFTWEQIFAATKAYVLDQEMKGEKYMTCSQYFIRKQQTDKTWISMLADWCQATIDGLDEPPENNFREKVF